MSHHPNVTRLQAAPGMDDRPKVHNARVHVLRCDGDTCTAEHHNQPKPEYETYVPYDWLALPDGTHRCPACRDPQQLAKEQRMRAKWIDSGMTVQEVRAGLAALHAREAKSYGY